MASRNSNIIRVNNFRLIFQSTNFVGRFYRPLHFHHVTCGKFIRTAFQLWELSLRLYQLHERNCFQLNMRDMINPHFCGACWMVSCLTASPHNIKLLRVPRRFLFELLIIHKYSACKGGKWKHLFLFIDARKSAVENYQRPRINKWSSL